MIMLGVARTLAVLRRVSTIIIIIAAIIIFIVIVIIIIIIFGSGLRLFGIIDRKLIYVDVPLRFRRCSHRILA